ncbi:cytochrome b-c1 complex subunit 6, mitochondrial [Schistocerca nitens]|uniref:cytochrome b-c1 complex subunit 6, mitochondrial n=1 Tax=Schistocerca nitens TaxID=7011 RepID=UPI002118D579|nr:cytochrome b-c1 complex subunit 6, mitochondrial [Schistocerca nitens]
MSLKVAVPNVKAQEEAEEEEEQELVDPQQSLKEQCGEEKKCAALYERYQACNDRVNSRSKTTETCTEELFDYLHCVDVCVGKQLFKFLK